MIKPKFVNNEIYHIYNRGVEKRPIFTSDKDRIRFIHDLYEMNNASPVINTEYRLKRDSAHNRLDPMQEREGLVEILSFCLMPNHYHLLLRQTKDKGVIKFMQKLGTAYTKYFNLKNDRVGPLFQGRFKAVLINENNHLFYIYHYIHLNPLDTIAPEWRENKIKNLDKSLEFLENYRWSSYLDFIGIKNFPSVINKTLSMEIFGNEKEYYKNLDEWLRDMSKHVHEFKDISLE